MKQKGFATTELVYLIIALLGLWGYVWNIVKLIDAATLGGMELVRAVGIFIFPVGAVLGFF